ncbi:NAD-dependent epimerase/dehydratase family protein [Pseudonocardia sp. GCM10023141]|uniref:NAD-dependent epimerase/dehydratase family protein n=1 Tax=Pseudonocardia sp. GCM10023141 TaxID=3252653 RepID=UPI00361BA374
MSARVLVVGAKGYVGAAFCRALLVRGHQVVALDLGTEPGRLADLADHLEQVDGDGSDLQTVLSAIGRRPIDAVYYGPFYRGENGGHSVARELDVMAAGAWRVFDLARAFPLRRVLFPSSTAVHGGQRGATVDEDSPLLPASTYGAVKLLCERVAIETNAAIGEPVVTALRLPSVYGPGASVASRQVNVPAVAAGRGRPAVLDVRASARVCVAHVDDVAAALVAAVEAERVPRTVYEIGGPDVTYAEIAAAVRETVPEAEIRYGARDQAVLPHAVDHRRAAQDLGLRHRPLAEGMRSVVDFERARAAARVGAT